MKYGGRWAGECGFLASGICSFALQQCRLKDSKGYAKLHAYTCLLSELSINLIDSGQR